eukprot:TRINITY_DN2427_c2_g1_i1.p1 TRINITY_DN2427_c2_g1~~TRINITY_DN2427_c2_g1_i1.p1  ORF type:complete len:292 (+),score=83.51 TRINITY_DN2427_c2_g1_i1:38-913(+)
MADQSTESTGALDAAAKAKARAEARRKKLLAGAGQRLARLGPGLDDEGSASSATAATSMFQQAVGGDDAAGLVADVVAGEQPPESEVLVEGLRERRPAAASEKKEQKQQHQQQQQQQHQQHQKQQQQLPPEHEDTTDAWALSLKIRRQERACRFFGSAMVAIIYGTLLLELNLLSSVPPLAGFFIFEVLVLAWFANLRHKVSTSSDKTADDEGSGTDLMAAMLGSAIGSSSSGTAKQATWMLAKLSSALGIVTEAFKLLQDAVWFLFVLLLVCSLRDTAASSAIFVRQILR